ncbi:Oidioi.mRNA.OKI2018_I69.chr2.g6476.t1.cds [Oikopleura dioica]|uniref:Oidioi.mRNA.OKI2018_I69.chr2.g6476.t1.cds n=1 Tax=Oikopleura dioica TaxID=34765 RepID=A0ABN7T7Y7_OIKDI|nr:Oidioi.mRNA.OKI2018_I69.chr2.g6476.t1.cds [Oikopleura dioica]
MAYRKGMKISKREMRSLQNSFGKTPFTQPDIHQAKEVPRETVLTKNDGGEWDRTWLQQMDLLSIFFEAPNHPKPVTVLDPQTEELYRRLVHEQEMEIFKKNEIERQERLARLPKDPRKRKSSEQQPAESKRRNIEPSQDQVVSIVDSPKRQENTEKIEVESTFQSEDYLQYKNNLQFRQQIAQLVDETDSEESAVEKDDAVDVFIPGFDDDSDEADDGFNMQSIEDEVDTIEEDSTEVSEVDVSEMDSTLNATPPPKTSPSARRSWYHQHEMLESSDDEDEEEENTTIIKNENQVNTEIAKQLPDDADENSDDDDDVQFVSETIVID